MIRERTGEVFNIAAENEFITGCTVSKNIYDNNNLEINIFAMAAETDISPEIYQHNKLILNHSGELIIYYDDRQEFKLEKFNIFIMPVDKPVGAYTSTGSVFTEIILANKGDDNMNKLLHDGEVFKLADLVPYQAHRIVNMDLINNNNLKFVIMAFDEGTGLSEHAAPGEALILALDGQGVIGYEGKEFVINQGESFKFAKNGKHYVKANSKFKMALLLTLE